MKATPELLFLSHRVPYPPDKGEKIRAWHILRHLARSHRVHLGCLADDPVDSEHMPMLRQICARVGCFPIRPNLQKLRALARLRPGRSLTEGAFYSPRLARWVADTLASYPIERLFVFSSGMAGYVVGGDSEIRILDLVDVDSEKWRAYAFHRPWPMSAIYRREADTLRALERKVALAFDMTLFASEPEADRFSSLLPECRPRLRWIVNGVDLEHFSPVRVFDRPFPRDSTNIVFTGTMDYWPNIDAVEWFAKDALKSLRGDRPHVNFWIVGAKPSPRVLRLCQIPGVKVTGRVSDVRPFLAHADAVVAPLRIARGIQNKVLEAMAMGRPVVATAEAFEGIRAVPGQDLLVCGTPEEMAPRIGQVLNGQHPTLGAAARIAVERNHNWSQTLRPLDELFPADTIAPTLPPAVGLASRPRLYEDELRLAPPSAPNQSNR